MSSGVGQRWFIAALPPKLSKMPRETFSEASVCSTHCHAGAVDIPEIEGLVTL